MVFHERQMPDLDVQKRHADAKPKHERVGQGNAFNAALTNANVDLRNLETFVLLGLQHGRPFALTSERIRPSVEPIMSEWSQTHLQRAQDDGDLEAYNTYQRTFVNEHGSVLPFEEIGQAKVTEPASSLSVDTISTNASSNVVSKGKGTAKGCGSGSSSIKSTRRTRRDRVGAGRSQLARAPVVIESDDTVIERVQAYRLRIDDQQGITEFIRDRLILMQQQTDKKIAKAWIKGICPKKQAKYPYQNNQKKKNGQQPVVPKWWPSVEQCPFQEPDHIDREQRMALCLHLLRLRPTTAQLVEWNNSNKDAAEKPEPVKYRDGSSWTEFLSDLTPDSVFDGFEGDEKFERRKKLLADLYRAARMEEEYLLGGYDGNAMFQWEEEPEPTTNKKATALKRRRASLAPEGQDKETSSSLGKGKPKSKRVKCSSTETSVNEESSTTQPPSNALDEKEPAEAAKNTSIAQSVVWTGALDPESFVGAFNPTQPVMPDDKPRILGDNRRGLAYNATLQQPLCDFRTGSNCSSPDTSLTSSFGSTYSGQQSMTDEYQTGQATGVFQAPDFASSHVGPWRNEVQVHHVMDVPQLPIETVPNSPMTMLNLQHQNLPTQDPHQVDYGMGGLPINMPTPQHQDLSSIVNHPYDNFRQFHAGPAPHTFDASTVEGGQAHYPFHPQFRSEALVQGCNLPNHYPQHDRNPYDHGMPFGYPEIAPEANIPAAALPGSMVRGFTGHGSGVGGGAMT